MQNSSNRKLVRKVLLNLAITCKIDPELYKNDNKTKSKRTQIRSTISSRFLTILAPQPPPKTPQIDPETEPKSTQEALLRRFPLKTYLFTLLGSQNPPPARPKSASKSYKNRSKIDVKTGTDTGPNFSLIFDHFGPQKLQFLDQICYAFST